MSVTCISISRHWHSIKIRIMKFSITIPAYKQRYLYEAIESCLAQTYKDFELIIVDDASPEDLKSVVDMFQDDRIRYYRNEKNCGALNVVDNWNICLEYAKGDYVICMGDDDKLLPNCLEEYSKLMDKYPGLNIYHGMTEIINEHSEVYNIQEARPEREGVYSMISGRLRNHRMQFIGDWLLKRDALENIQGYVKMPMAWGSDDLTAYTLAVDGGVANSQIPVFQYRVNSLTISNSGNYREKVKTQFRVFGLIEKILNDKTHLSNEKDNAFRLSMQQLMPEIIRLSVDNYMRSDMKSGGKLMSLLWWLRNISFFGLSKKEVLKVFVKSF